MNCPKCKNKMFFYEFYKSLLSEGGIYNTPYFSCPICGAIVNLSINVIPSCHIISNYRGKIEFHKNPRIKCNHD